MCYVGSNKRKNSDLVRESKDQKIKNTLFNFIRSIKKYIPKNKHVTTNVHFYKLIIIFLQQLGFSYN
jgi:hypothetical protein